MSCSYLATRALDVKNSDTLSEVSESGTTTSGFNSNWASKEELRDFVTKHGLKDITDLYQERFRVDRKKLQQMLSGDNEALIPADVFFAKIMEDTDTYITWPSKLKLGAKSKRDPYVGIAGYQENVQAAKERVMAVLYTRGNRVTMKMDISYTDHSHIIGRGGLSIKRVMDETQCHIHFPDSNRSNATEKSNQVSISGDFDCVENARSRVRELLPLVFGFEPPIISQHIDNTCPYVVKIQEQYKVQIMFKARSKLHAIIVLVKGAEWDVEQVKHATILLMDYMCDNLANQIPVQMSIQISPQHHQTVLGKNNSNLKAIMQYTKCQIIFPDTQDQNIPSLRKSNISISGNIHNVYTARQLLIGSLPLLIVFDLPEDTTMLKMRAEQLVSIQNSCQVTINIRQRNKQHIKSCVIKGIEKEATNIYRARNMVLGIEDSPVSATIPTSYHLPPDSGAFSPNHDLLATPTNINPSPLSPMINSMFSWHYGNNATAAAAACATSAGSPGSNTSGGTNGAAPPFVGILKKNHFTFIEPASSSQTQSNMSSGYQTFGAGEKSNNSMLSSISSISSIENSGVFSPTHLNPHHQQGYKNYHSESLSPIEGGPSSSCTSDYNSMMTTNSAAVCDKKQFNSASGSCSTSSTSYDSKRLAGFKAMQAPASLNPDVYRVPNNCWSGYGISHTSPAGFTDAKNLEMWKNQQQYNYYSPKTSSSSAGSASSPNNNSGNNQTAVQVTNNSDIFDNAPSHMIKKVTVGNWTDLPSLLNSLNLEKYVNLFIQNEVDLSTFATFNDKDLMTIGISAFGSRRKMLLAISELNRRTNSFSAAPGAERKIHCTP